MIELAYARRDQFQPYHARTQRFACGVAHRRCGKTVATVNDMIVRAACTTKKSYRAAFLAPFLGQAKAAAWEYFKFYARPLFARPPHESELWVELFNGARIRIHGADNADALRGGYLDDVVLDEFADMNPGVWSSVIRPMLADRRGTATFIGTPKGRNEFFRLYERACDDPEWFTFLLPASFTGLIPNDELDSARRDMTPEQYEQEFQCSFDAAIVGAYYAKELADAEQVGRITEVKRVGDIPIDTAWDLGVGDATSIWAFQAYGGEIRILGHYETSGQALSHYTKELEARGWAGGIDYVPHDAKVRSLDTGKTRIETLFDLGRNPSLVPAHTVADGINATRLAIPRMWFDKAGCGDAIEMLRQYRAEYDEKKKVLSDAPRHDWTSHCADAMRYLAMAWRQKAGIVEEPKKENKPLADMTYDEYDNFDNRLNEKEIRV